MNWFSGFCCFFCILNMTFRHGFPNDNDKKEQIVIVFSRINMRNVVADTALNG